MTTTAARPTPLHPQPGPQTAFLESEADIVLYGGAAGAGGTHGLLLHCLKHVDKPDFRAAVFCRERSQIKVPGGLWDNALDLFKLLDTVYIEPRHYFRFRSGATVQFSHLEKESTVHHYQGAQIPLLCFDGLTQFTKAQFLYMLSRNRSAAGVKPLVRATCHPDPDSWLAEFISWWIDQETGYPIPERSGIVRYFLVVNDQVQWGDDRGELAANFGEQPEHCASFTFISANVYDNKILLQQEPSFVSHLKALGTVEQTRLLGGNWKIRPAAEPSDNAEAETVAGRSAWDIAAANQNPDTTNGC